jgi:23S rRNA pseudouridine1911/1915/1917 synthase
MKDEVGKEISSFILHPSSFPMSHLFQFHINEEDADCRLDHFLWSRLGGLSRMRIDRLIAEGACLVNGSAARAGHHLQAGESVDIEVGDAGPTSMVPEDLPIYIIYEDEHMLVLEKPAGMLVHPTLSVRTGTLLNALAYYLNRLRIADCGLQIDMPVSNPQSAIGNRQTIIRPGLVHRLDRETSGLMVIAKSQRALSALSRHFQRRKVEKRYTAIVCGFMSKAEGAIIAPIGRDPDSRPHWRVMESGKPSETRFRVLSTAGNLSLVELEPVTGRTNQLRIHCAYAGHPIVGDSLHSGQWSGIGGQGKRMKDEGGRMKKEERDEDDSGPSSFRPHPSSFRRLCLHASELAFHHPATGQWTEFTSPTPAEFLRVMEDARLLALAREQ